MRNLENDLEWLSRSQDGKDLSDEYLKGNCPDNLTREEYQDVAPEFSYGITFVESDIAREWLERAIKAEELIKKYESS